MSLIYQSLQDIYKEDSLGIKLVNQIFIHHDEIIVITGLPVRIKIGIEA